MRSFKICDRGREGFRVPSLRTVLAVFPHTALQLLVPHRGCLARYRTVDCVNSKKLREGGYSPPLTPSPAPTPCVPSVERLRLAIVQVWSSHRFASLPRIALRHFRNSLASGKTSRIQLPTSLPIGAILLAAPLAAQSGIGIGWTHTLLTRQHHRRTHSRESGNPGATTGLTAKSGFPLTRE
jgi:hypothetical protein